MRVRSSAHEVDRTKLAASVATAKFALIVAPAGYGKSRLARAAVRRDRAVICDLAGVSTLVQLARRIVGALLAGGVTDNGGFASALAALPGNTGTANRWAELAASAWLEEGGPQVVVFENAEAVADNPVLVARIRQLVGLDAGRRIIVCTRVDPVAVPGADELEMQTCAVGFSDLEFTAAETVELLRGAGATRTTAQRAAGIARGWPVAALVFAGEAENGTLDAALEKAGSIADLNAYIESQVFDALDETALELLGALALIGTADERALQAFGTSVQDVVGRVRNHPFFVPSGTTIHVHPLARAALGRLGVGRERLRIAASDCSEIDPLLAAGFFVAAGELDAAADLLGSALAPLLLGNIPTEVAELVDAIGPDVLARHPAAWSATMTSRAYAKPTHAMLAEARSAWQALAPDAPAAEVFGAATGILNWSIFLNRTNEVAAAFGVLEQRLSHEPPESPYPLLTRLWKCWVGLRDGRRVDVEDVAREMSPLLAASSELTSAFEYCVRALAAVHELDFATMRSAMDRAMDAAINAKAAVYTVLSAQHAAFYAWLDGDARYVEKCLSCLERYRSPISDPGTLYFIECAVGDPAKATPRHELPTSRAQASLIGASRAESRSDRLRLVERALEAALVDGSALIVCVAWLGIALVDDSRRDSAFAAAMVSAQRIDGGAWTAAVSALKEGRSGGLDRLAAVFAATPAQRNPDYLRCADRSLVIDERAAPLTPREWQLLLALKYADREIDAPALSAVLQPDVDPAEGGRTVRVWVHRLRARLGERDIVESTTAGYRLRIVVATDVDLCLDLLERQERGDRLAASQLQMLTATVSRRNEALANLAEEWMAPYRRKLLDLCDRFESQR